MKTIIGIDYGLHYTGLALATSAIAEPLKTVPTDHLEDYLTQLINIHQPELIVMGLSEHRMGSLTQTKASEINAKFDLPVVFQDETLSSQETRLKLAKSSQKKLKREGKIDHFVAASILQDYLDSMCI